MFSQSSFEQNSSVQLKLLRFSAIFLLRKKSQKCGTFCKKCVNAGIKPKCDRTLEVRPGRITKKLELKYDYDCERDDTKSLFGVFR